MLDNGTYKFETSLVRGVSVDLNNVSGAYLVDLVVNYSKGSEPDTEKVTVIIEEKEEEILKYSIKNLRMQTWLIVKQSSGKKVRMERKLQHLRLRMSLVKKQNELLNVRKSLNQ